MRRHVLRLVSSVCVMALGVSALPMDPAGLSVVPAAADAGPTWDYVYGDPGPENFSRYQEVRAAPDGSTYLSGFFTGAFAGLVATDVYRPFVQKVSPAGVVLWTRLANAETFTTVPVGQALVLDGLGTVIVRASESGQWSTFDASGNGTLRPAAGGGFPGTPGASKSIGVSTGGVLRIAAADTQVVQRLSPTLDTVWTFDAAPYINVARPSLAEAPDGSFWVVGTKTRSLPTGSDALVLLHISASGALITTVKHFGRITEDTFGPVADTNTPSAVLSVGPTSLWVQAMEVLPTTGSNSAFPYRRAIWSFDVTDGHQIAEVDTVLDTEQIVVGDVVYECRQLDFVRPLPQTYPSAVNARRVVMGGSRLVLLARCQKFNPQGTPNQPAPADEVGLRVLLTYELDARTGTGYRRIGGRVMAADVTVSAIDADDLGNVVVAGSTVGGEVFSSHIERGPGGQSIAGPERAVASRNPTGNLVASPVGFTALSPMRLFDTRADAPQGLVRVTKQRYGGAGNVLRVKVAGAAGVPASGAGAVSLNVTVVDPDGPGFVTVFPCGERPLAANLNYVAGQIVPNAVITPMSDSGEVCFFSLANAHLIADVNGWFATGAGFSPVLPTRLFETRQGVADGAVPVVHQRVGGDQVLRVKVTGVAGVPSTGVGAVSLNVTAISPDGPGFVTVFPCGERPLAANLNYVAGQIVPNAVIAPVSDSGEVCLYSLAPTDLVADVSGWFARGSSFSAVTPLRVFDTRPGSPQGVVPVVQQTYGGPTNVLRVKVTGVAGVPTTGVGAVSLNVTAISPDGPGFVTVFPCGTRPLAANLNYVAGQIVPNAVIAPVSDSGEVCFFSLANTHLVADVNGWFAT